MLIYVLIVSREDSAETIYRSLKALEDKNIRKLFVVSGEYNLLAEIKAQNETNLKEVLNKIRSTEGVITMNTLPVMHKTREHDTLPKTSSH